MEAPADDGLCSMPFGTTKVSPLRESDRRLAAVGTSQRDVEFAVQDEEELVGVLVDVPDVLALGVGDADVIVVDTCHDARAVDVVERPEGAVHVYRLIHPYVLPLSRSVRKDHGVMDT